MVDLDSNTAQHHRASYILEMGVWRATCQTCGHSVTESRRGRAAAVFRNHIRDVLAHADPTSETKRKGPDPAPLPS